MIKLNSVHLYKDSETLEKSIIISYATKRLKKKNMVLTYAKQPADKFQHPIIIRKKSFLRKLGGKIPLAC